MLKPTSPNDQKTKKNQNQKKVDRAGLKGSKVVFANTYESQAMLELTIEADRLFRRMRNNQDIDKSAKALKLGRKMICDFSRFLNALASELEHPYAEPAVVAEFQRMIEKDSSKKK